ncbi:MAG: hypothetical protein DAHOPDDO_00055 [Ignavibacteriaceae bacterium]|nr:hypothetical protein [Ignavibacteriaceae bacterium]
MAKRKKVVKKETTAQRLSSIVKSCRKIMRKDKGLNGDADRLPMLTWLMFLKFLDDTELLLETDAQLNDMKFIPTIEPPYRWRDWAKNTNFTGDDLLSFINNENALLPNGGKGLGLFKYLRSLQSESGKERKDVVRLIFGGVVNRMIDGYMLRDVVDKIDGIHFTNNEEVNTLSLLYESLLKEMRDAAGDAGEFYTPRPVVKFMVEMINPNLGETILDPACGTGGFLVESFEHLRKQAKTIEQNEVLQKKSLLGGEAKPLPFLLSQMNLLLHGLEYPDIKFDNSLKVKITELSDKDRVNIIITNPPFGGEEEKSVQNYFPADMQTSETALLFLQLIMRKLNEKKVNQEGGRSAIVVPNGFLFFLGVAAKIKEEMLDNFNLHTIVRLGEGVFAPYTDIHTNLLFFHKGEPTNEIWFYELPMPEGKKKYSKTKPLKIEEFNVLRKWWFKRKENGNAWRIDFRSLLNEALEKAEPHRLNIEKCKLKIDELKQEIINLKNDLKENGKSNGNELKNKIDELNASIKSMGEDAKASQQKYDEIKYAIYNLDLKNPNRKDAIQYRDPKELISEMLEKEHKVLTYLEEIKGYI